MGTVLSYMVLFLVVGAGAVYYNPALKQKLVDVINPQQSQNTTPDLSQTSKKAKQKRPKTISENKGTSTQVSSNEAPVSKKRKIISEPVSKEITAKTSDGSKATLSRVVDDINDAEFARQLKQAQQGTKLQPQAQQITSKKDRRAASAQTSHSAINNVQADSAETSSNGGRDADDDMSPADTPPSSVSRAGDISDMLEPTGAKLSSIKLTNTESSQTKKVAPKQFEAAQTKKQRQRQKQNEENRRLREESDKQHAAKMHKQISGARVAEGTSKQTKATTFTQNAWQPKPAQAESQAEPPAQQSLLDTFDPSEQNTKPAVSTKPIEEITRQPDADVPAAKEKLGEEKTQALAASERERPELGHKASWADQLNAEEQDQWAQKLVEEEQWEPVTTKKGKKKAKKDNDTSSEASQPVANLPTTFASATKTSAGSGKQAVSNGTKPARPQITNRFDSVGGTDWEA